MKSIARDTRTGTEFENWVDENKIIKEEGIDTTKYLLYGYLKSIGVNWKDIISKKLLPDRAFICDNILVVYEIKFQDTAGSVDEKLQTCDFKVKQFNKIAKAIGLEKATYTYILCDWYKKPEYKDQLEYIKSCENCNYVFATDCLTKN